MFEELGRAVDPLTRRQRWIVLAAALVVAVSRFLAVSRSLWDWDEALFTIAMRDYDVFHHHPHPPGFPLFIGLAKLVRLFVDSDFRALQSVTVCAALLLFPAAFLLGRELRLRFDAAFIAALLVAFFPNAWYFGGTAFSDVPALTLVVLACALLLRGCRDPRAYLAGSFVLALAAGFRPQNLLVGLAPALIATACRIRHARSVAQPVAAVLIGGLTVGLAYGSAAVATGDLDVYLTAVRAHGEYIRDIDSFRSAERPPLLHVFDDFFFRPYRYSKINTPLALFVLLGLVVGLWRRRMDVALALATFGPFAFVGWLMLDRHSASRFAIGWSPLIAVLATVGILAVADLVGRIGGRDAFRTAAATLLTLALIIVMISWTLPLLGRVRRNISPPMQAIAWIHANVPRDSKIYVAHSMIPFADLSLPDYPREVFRGADPETAAHRAWVLREGTSARSGAQNFVWRQDNLAKLARRRYFSIAVVPHQARMRFGAGWYGEESSGSASWRWMGARSTVHIGPAAEPGELTLRAAVPLDGLRAQPVVTLTLNGAVLDRFTVTSEEFERTWPIPALVSEDNVLVIETTGVLNPLRNGLSADGRDLGLRLDALGWSERRVAE